jgi:putative phosphoribosyl transferase
MHFIDRVDAGHQLARMLEQYRSPQTIVLGLPRGGVPVAAEVARALEAPLDVFVVRKIGAPMQPELGIGAIAEGGELWIDARMASLAGAGDDEIRGAVEREVIELQRRVQLFRGHRALPALEGKTVIVVDDGIATGSTDRVALSAIRKLHPARLVLGVPVAATDSLRALRPLADDIVCVLPRDQLGAVGRWYRDFEQTTDPEVLRLLEQSRRTRVATDPHAPG